MQPHSITNLQQRKNAVLLGLAIVFLSLFIYSSILRPLLEQLLPGLPRIPGGIGIKTLFMMLFSIFHSAYVLGWQRTLVFFGITVAVTWCYEHVGVETGLIYGAYHYTDALGAKLGNVPIVIPIAWFMMIYPSYIIANLIGSGRTMMTKNNNNDSRTSLAQILWLSFLSAVVMTAWDLVVDPYLSGPTEKAWIWEGGGGQYFGVPLHNFGGWILTTFTIYFLFRLLSERTLQALPSRPLTTSIMLLPLISYGTVMVANIIPGEPPELRIIGPIVMGIPLAIAAGRLLMNKNEDTTYVKQSEQ
ncbi:MAG TPA: carotenoid biosynthesis protein [Nitrososphaeraceae archaeon]|nr:carotenoid biosynthesis protein [Nitrososphaeraceae archaeon]